MKGEIAMKRSMLTVIFVAVCMVMGGFFVSHVEAAGISYKCVIPYNIKTSLWNTGIHIFAQEATESEVFFITFESDDGWYKTVYLDMSQEDYPRGWTGTIQDLFAENEFSWIDKKIPTAPYIGPIIDPIIPTPVFPDIPVINPDIFKSPSCITVYSCWGPFTVTQFISNTVTGFGFQVLYSWPTVNDWIYPDSSE